MVIQHVMAASNALCQTKINSKQTGKSTKRLSSGYQINCAGDNAAGLAISEKMRGQIRGINRASDNAQDGISLVQTAEGAMQESQNILHRMRELSVQAANDTYTEEDRNCIKVELDELAKELDRIANTTEYNTMKVINGDFSLQAQDVKTRLQERLKGSWLQDALTRIEDALGIGVKSDVTLDVKFEDLSAGVVASMSSTYGGSKFTLRINNDFINGLSMEDLESSSGPITGGILLDRVLTHEMTHAVTMHHASGTIGNIPLWFMEGIAEAVQGLNRTTETEAQVQAKMAGFSNSVTGEDAYSMGYFAVSYMANNTTTGTFEDFLQDMDSGATFDELLNKYYGVTDENAFVDKLKSMAAMDISGFLSACQITLGDGKEDALGNWDQTSEDVVTNMGFSMPIEHTSEKMSINGHKWTINWDKPNSLGKTMNLQIGANAGQEISFYIGDMRSKNLIGMEDINVSTHDTASVQITRFDTAIQKVSGYRASLGAVQNRLEHTIMNLDNAEENLTTSESKIRDTDMAEEMTAYSKNNILTQASQAMLAQANQSTQGVLTILQ